LRQSRRSRRDQPKEKCDQPQIHNGNCAGDDGIDKRKG
jgi:hypothetical protein